MKLLRRRVCFVLFSRSIKYTFWASGGFFFFFRGVLGNNCLVFPLLQHYLSSWRKMEQLTMRWENLTLSEKEQVGYVLPEDHWKGEFMITAKFLTSRFFCKWKLWQELSNNYGEWTGGLGLEIKAITLWEGFLSQLPISRYCPLWLMLFGFCLTDLLNPTSGRDAFHVCLISFEPKTHV